MDEVLVRELRRFALAMQDDNNALVDRLEAATNAARAIRALDYHHWQDWDKHMPRANRMVTSGDLIRSGAGLQTQCMKWASENGIAVFNDDGEACKLLESRGYRVDGGFIRRPSKSHVPTLDELEAVDYLCQEWDYSNAELHRT